MTWSMARYQMLLINLCRLCGLSVLLDTLFNSIYYLYRQIDAAIISYFYLNGYSGRLDTHYISVNTVIHAFE